MRRIPRTFRLGPALAFAFAAVAVLALGACGGDAPPPARNGTAASAATTVRDGATPAVAAQPVEYAFPTGPAVTVPLGYEPPGDRVDSTGAHLPANGKPTLVFVDAIW